MNAIQMRQSREFETYPGGDKPVFLTTLEIVFRGCDKASGTGSELLGEIFIKFWMCIILASDLDFFQKLIKFLSEFH
jgi:hypothetical protein